MIILSQVHEVLIEHKPVLVIIFHFLDKFQTHSRKLSVLLFE